MAARSAITEFTREHSGFPRVKLTTGYLLLRGRSALTFSSSPLHTPQFHLRPPSPCSSKPRPRKEQVTSYIIRRLECAQKSLNARETAANQPSRRSLGRKFGPPPSFLRRQRGGGRERYESSGTKTRKPSRPASQPASHPSSQPGVNYRPYVSLSLFSAAKISLEAQKRRRRIAAHLPRERASLRTRNNARVARRVIKNHAYAVPTIPFIIYTGRPTFEQCSSVRDSNSPCMQRRAALARSPPRWLTRARREGVR